MTTTATFSNGFTDTYKGTRPVKAAWMVTNTATGKVLASGHSLDIIKARKTAEGTATERGFDGTHTIYTPSRRFGNTVRGLHIMLADARKAGIEGVTIHNAQKLVLAHNAAINAACRARCTIEVIAL